MSLLSKKDTARERDAQPGVIETFEKMLDSHVQLMFRNIER
jgi:hypothetical protein